jgi:hypothetical protein
MARSISVKIPTALLISSIESKIAEIDESIALYPSLVEKHEIDMDIYKAKLVEFVRDYLGKNSSKVGYSPDDTVRILSNHYNNGRVEIQFDSSVISNFPDKPETPEKPNQSRHYGNTWSNQKSLLEKNLKILRMTSQEEVSASTYGAVLEFL